MPTLQEIEAEIARRQATKQPQLQAVESEIDRRQVGQSQEVPELVSPEADQPEALDQLRQKIIENPAGATVAEFGSAVSRGAINLLDFFGPDAINSALELAGVEARIPTIAETEIGKAATTGQFMEPGLARKAVRTAGEYVAPVMATGQVSRTLAQAIPKAAIPTTTQRVIQSAQAAPQQEAAGAILSGAGREVGGEIGEEVAGEEGRQVGEFVGGILTPIAGSLAKESGKLLITKGAKKLLSESSPTIEGLKQAARKVYDDIDNLGVTVNPSSVTRLSTQLETIARKEGFDAGIHPKVSAALKRFEEVKNTPQNLSQIDILRRVTNAARNSNDPDERRLGNILIERVDDFLDNLNKANFAGAYKKDVGAKYRDARQLWRRAKKGEVIRDAFDNAARQATGFENGIRVQFRSILNSKKKSKGFTKEELKAMDSVVKGTSLQNTAKMLGRFGFSEGQASNMLMGSLGVAGGATLGGAPGAVAVPLIGQLSRNLAQKLTRKGAENVDLIVKAGKNGIDITKAYMQAVPKNQRSPQELTELLLRPDISLKGLQRMIKTAPKEQKKLISDAVYLTNTLKSFEGSQSEQQQ